MKKIILIGLAVVISLVVVVFVYLNYVYIPQQLKPMVIKLLEENLQKKVSIGKATYFPIKGVLFSKVEIVNSDQTPFLEVETIDFGLKSIPVIKKNAFSAKLKLVIKGLLYKQQDIHVQGGCKIDLDANIKAKDIAFSAIIDLKDLNVKGIKETGEITKINGRIIASESSFESENISAAIGGQALNILTKGDYDKKDINIRKFNIDYVDTKLSIKGKVSELENPKIDFALEGLIKLKDIAIIISGIPIPKLAGDCQINAKCKGPIAGVESLIADAKIVLSKASVDKIKFANLKADIKLENGALDISPLDCDFYKGKITGAAKVTIIEKDIPVQCSIDAKDIDIEQLAEDLIGQNMGQGMLTAHVEISGSAVDLNLLKGTGSFKVLEGKIKMPPNFSKVANTLQMPALVDMNIEQASANFTLNDGKLQTQDLVLSAVDATILGKGYIDLETYVDFEAAFETREGRLPVRIKVYDKIVPYQLKYKPIFSKEDLMQTGIQSILKKDGGNQSGEFDLQNQIKKGLEKLFR